MLLVDDDPVLLEVLATVLRLERFEVATAPDGPAALTSVTLDRPDAVVCDVAMPGMDGLEVCRQLKGSPDTSSIPVVLLTVRGGATDRAAGEAAGCDAHLTKPFGPVQLVELLRGLTPAHQGPPPAHSDLPPAHRGPPPDRQGAHPGGTPEPT